MFAVDVDGVFRCCQCALPHMIREKAGVIVNIASMWGQTGASCEVHYSAAKAAVIGPHAGAGQGAGALRHPRELRIARRNRHKDERAPSAPGTMEALREENAAVPHRHAGGRGGGRRLPGRRGRAVHHRPGARRERRLRGLTRPALFHSRKNTFFQQQSAPPPPAHRPVRGGSVFSFFYSDEAQSELHALSEPSVQILDLHALLLHGVAGRAR